MCSRPQHRSNPASDVVRAVEGRRARARLKELECEVESLITSPKDMESGAASTEGEESESLASAVMARRVYLPPNQQVDVRKVLLANRLYAAEAKLLEGLQDILIACLIENDIDLEVLPTEPNQNSGAADGTAQLPATTLVTDGDMVGAYQGVQVVAAKYSSLAKGRIFQRQLANLSPVTLTSLR